MSVLPIHHGYSGDIIVQFRAAIDRVSAAQGLSLHLEDSSQANPLAGVAFTLEPLIGGISGADLRALEGNQRLSLVSFYRLYLREAALTVPQLLAVIRYIYAYTLPLGGGPVAPVVYAYPEMRVSLAGLVWNDPLFAPDQHHLQDTPDGVGARSFWARDAAGLSAAGLGTRLYAVEHGWETRHADLAGRRIAAPIHGDNAADLPVKDLTALRRVNHGTASLGVVAATDDCPGRIGAAPALASVTLSSCYEAARKLGEHVASAIVAAVRHHVNAGPAPAALMLQVQRGLAYPTEIDLADFLAIQLAVRRGMTVIEPAGNGHHQLGTPNWPDSGAILVGALDAGGSPRADCNHGPRVDLYAPGTDIRTSGAPEPGGVPDRSGGPIAALRRADFRRTSAAAAVAAGAALCLLGRAQSLRALSASSTDVRGWFSQVQGHHGHGASPIDLLDDALLTGGAPMPPVPALNATPYPWRRPAGNITVPSIAASLNATTAALAVTNPQFGEGNTDVYEIVNGQEVHAGFARTPALSGSNPPHLTPGGAPVTGHTWTERWVLKKADLLTNPPDAWIYRYDDGDSSSNPNGEIWSAGVVSYFEGLRNGDADWRQAHASVKYEDPVPDPGGSAPQHGLGPDSNYTIRHYTLKQKISGVVTVVGQLRRRIKTSPDVVVDRWVFYGNYTFPDVGTEVKAERDSSAESQETGAWLKAMYTEGQGNNTPRPKWYCVTKAELASPPISTMTPVAPPSI